MSNHDPERREFLRLVIALPLAFAIGCDTERYTSTAGAPPLSPEESLKKLIRILGPWSAAEKEQAEDFAQRFLAAKDGAALYIPASPTIIQSLAARYPAEAMAIDEISLRDLSPEERELLIKLAQQLYSYVEVRFWVSNEPRWGECQSDRTRHTRAPA